MIFGDGGGIAVQSWLAISNDAVGEMREVEEPWLLNLLLLGLI